jgi:hypothetical protein
MIETLFGGSAAWFGVPAILGTFYFLVRLVLMLAGMGGGGDLHAGDGGDVAAGGAHGDSTDALKVLSIHSFAAFLMGFGWGGLAAHHGFDVRWSIALLWGLAAGAAMVWIQGLALKALYDLQSSGTVSIESAVGAEGTVYVRIPAQGAGRGQVRVIVDGRERTYNAITEGDPIERPARVRVVHVNEDNTVTVAECA